MKSGEQLKVAGKARSEPTKAWPRPVFSSMEHPFPSEFLDSQPGNCQPWLKHQASLRLSCSTYPYMWALCLHLTVPQALCSELLQHLEGILSSRLPHYWQTSSASAPQTTIPPHVDSC